MDAWTGTPDSVMRLAPLVLGLARASSALRGQTPAPDTAPRPMPVAEIVQPWERLAWVRVQEDHGSRPAGP